ncbi:hypothetical protein ACF0H5_016512 [Mactra antiquata]
MATLNDCSEQGLRSTFSDGRGFCDTLTRYDVTRVTLYTDLVDIIDVNATCKNKTSNINSTQEIRENISNKPGIVLSKYKLYKIDLTSSTSDGCEEVDVKQKNLPSFNWTCFSTGSDVTRATNWILINCLKWTLISVDCVDGNFSSIFDNLCKPDINVTNSKTCKTITFGETNNKAICSKYFYIQKATQTINSKDITVSTADILAYVCIAFILTTFIITMLIPANTCKPSYKFDKQQCLRVPMEIYEMYGVSYKPSTRRKITRKSFQNDGSSTVNKDIVNKVKAEILNNMGDENHGFNKMMFNESRNVNENDDVDEDKDDVMRTDDVPNDKINEQDSGDYDTIFLPDENDTIPSIIQHEQNNLNGNDNIIANSISVTKLAEVISTNMKGFVRRNQNQQRYPQYGRNRCDTVTEEDEPSESDIANDDTDDDDECDDGNNRTKSNEAKGHDRKRHHGDTNERLNDVDESDTSSIFAFNDRAIIGSCFHNSVTNVAYESEFNENQLERIHKVKRKLPTSLMKHKHCKSDSRSRNRNKMVNDESSTSSGYEEGLINDKMRRQNSKINKRTSTNREVDSPDEHQPSVRPRISITVEFPQIFGNPSFDGNPGEQQIDKSSLRTVNSTKDTKRDFKNSRRSLNEKKKKGRKDTHRKKNKKNDTNTSNPERKFSLC